LNIIFKHTSKNELIKVRYQNSYSQRKISERQCMDL